MLVCVLVVVLGLLYTWQLQPGIAPHGDISKFQFAGPLAGTVHQTGYPLYLMITWLSARVVPGVDIGTAATAVSSVAAIGAVVVTFFALRELRVRPVIAAAAGFMLGVAPYVFYFATVAEVYALNLLFMSAILLALLRWRRTGSDVDLGIAVALLALSFAHHMTTVLLVPGILVFVWLVDRRTFMRARVWLYGAGALLAAASLYGYLIWRSQDPATLFVEVVPRSWRDLPPIWLGAGATGSFDLDLGSILSTRLPSAAWDVVRSTLLVLPLAVAGFRALWRDSAGAMLALWAGGAVGFALVFRLPDIAGFLIPVVFLVVLVAGVGAEWITGRYLKSTAVGLTGLVLIVAMGLAVGIAFVNLQSHDEYEARTRTWLAEVPQGSVLAASYTDAMAAFYVALVEGERTDITTISDYPLADPQRSVLGRYLAGEVVEVPHSREVLQPGRPVYAPGQGWACDLTRAGFGIEQYTENLYRVLPLALVPLPGKGVAELCEAADA